MQYSQVSEQRTEREVKDIPLDGNECIDFIFFSCWNVKLNTQHICNGAQISFTEHRVSMLSLGVAGAHSGYFNVIKAPGGQGC